MSASECVNETWEHAKMTQPKAAKILCFNIQKDNDTPNYALNLEL